MPKPTSYKCECRMFMNLIQTVIERVTKFQLNTRQIDFHHFKYVLLHEFICFTTWIYMFYYMNLKIKKSKKVITVHVSPKPSQFLKKSEWWWYIDEGKACGVPVTRKQDVFETEPTKVWIK
jgi:hypothetical protein